MFANVFDDKPREMKCLIDGGSTQSFIYPLAVADKYLKSNDLEFTLENFQNHWGLSATHKWEWRGKQSILNFEQGRDFSKSNKVKIHHGEALHQAKRWCMGDPE